MAGRSLTEHPASTVPRDRAIDVRTIDEGLWLRVKWDPTVPWFEVIGEDTWLLPVEIDAWLGLGEITVAESPLSKRLA